MDNSFKVSIIEDRNIELILNYIKNSKYLIEKIYLFGSHADNTNKEDSDYDLLILFHDTISDEELKKDKLAIILDIHKLIPDQAFDILIRRNSEFLEYKDEINTLYNEIHETGKLVYENRYGNKFLKQS